MIFSLGDAVDLTDKASQLMFKKESKLEKQRFYNKYFNVVTGITDYLEKDSSITGLGQADRISENAVITQDEPIQGFDQTYTQIEYGKMLPITKQMWKFGIKKRKLQSVVRSLIASCERKREQLCADRLDNGFSTSYTVNDGGGNYSATISGGDGVAAFSAAHTREDGGSNWNNIITDGTDTNMDYAYDVHKALGRTASLVKDGKGNDMDGDYNTLIFKKGTSNFYRAREIRGAIRAAGKKSLPGSQDNDAAGVDDFEIIALPWLKTNTAYYFAFDSSMVNDEFGFQYKESQSIQLEGPNVVFKTGEMQYKTTMMFDIGFNDARYWAASKNDNS